MAGMAGSQGGASRWPGPRRRSDRKALAKRAPKRKAISKDMAEARGQRKRKRKRPAAGSKNVEA